MEERIRGLSFFWGQVQTFPSLKVLVTAEAMGNRVENLYDVGVARIHRILSERARLTEARVIIVVAGMEGALPLVWSAAWSRFQ